MPTWLRTGSWMTAAAVLIATQSACVSVAEHRKLEREVLQLKRVGGPAGSGERVAELRAQLDGVERRLARLEGRVDETQHTAGRALDEAKHAREEAAGSAAVYGGESVPPGPSADGSPVETPLDAPGAPPSEIAAATAPTAAIAPATGERIESGASVQEVAAYREAHASYGSGNYDTCIDRFRGFLQTYPTSPYADDAAYWMAECHFKKGDYKSAILRFDDVVARYPEGDKSADALYRQGEALLKLGPGYSKAASKAFERVIAEYPDSPRATEAKRQLDLLAARG